MYVYVYLFMYSVTNAVTGDALCDRVSGITKPPVNSTNCPSDNYYWY